MAFKELSKEDKLLYLRAKEARELYNEFKHPFANWLGKLLHTAGIKDIDIVELDSGLPGTYAYLIKLPRRYVRHVDDAIVISANGVEMTLESPKPYLKPTVVLDKIGKVADVDVGIPAEDSRTRFIVTVPAPACIGLHGNGYKPKGRFCTFVFEDTGFIDTARVYGPGAERDKEYLVMVVSNPRLVDEWD